MGENFLSLQSMESTEEDRVLNRVDVAEQERNAALKDRELEKELEEKEKAATEASAADKTDPSL